MVITPNYSGLIPCNLLYAEYGGAQGRVAHARLLLSGYRSEISYLQSINIVCMWIIMKSSLRHFPDVINDPEHI